MKRRANETMDDLFAAATGNAAAAETPARPLIASPLVAESEEWLSNRATTLGSLLASDRAAEYVAILRAFAKLRDGHEPEPLHEDVAREVCGEDADANAESLFKGDIRQLKEWGLVTERIEKERLRGYRDTRRTKFRYRLHSDAVAFVAWLAERRADDLNPEGGDITGSLLDMQCSLLHELRRLLRAVNAETVDYESAGDVLYRLHQLNVYVEQTARTLQKLNLKLLSFGAVFKIEEAQEIVGELGAFLDKFGRRFGSLREEIAADIAEISRPAHAKRWEACVERVRVESSRFRHVASAALPDAKAILSDAAAFYAAGGNLSALIERVVDSARQVWGKLNARLRELERRNHRLEDIGARLSDLSRFGEGEYPFAWMRSLIECATMRGDAQIRPDGEKSRPPLPKKSSAIRREKIVSWITPRRVGEKANVASIEQARGERLKEWMEKRGVYPGPGGAKTLGGGTYEDFGDFRGIVGVIEAVRLGGGAKARRYLEIEGRPRGDLAKVSAFDGDLEFEDLTLNSATERKN